MTYLLLQTFLLLLSAYFLGALIACLAKRAVRTTEDVLLPAAATTVAAAPALASVPPVKPRVIDPIQPKIDVLARPEPKPAPVTPDTSRFDRALSGALTASAGVARKSLVEIRPSVLPSPTAPAAKPQAAAPAARPAPAPTPAAAPVAPPPPKPMAAAPVAAPQPAPPPASQTVPQAAASAAASAAAAVAAAKAAAAALPAKPAPVQATPAPAQSLPQVKPPVPPTVTAPILDGDDLQRIRAIDEDTEQRLKGLGVRRYEEMAHWTAADVNRVNQALGLTGRIEREQWVEQAQILAKGGETYYSRNRGTPQRSASASPAASLSGPTGPKSDGPPAQGSSPADARTAANHMNATTAAAAAAALSRPSAATAAPSQTVSRAAPQPVSQASPQPVSQAAPQPPQKPVFAASSGSAQPQRSVAEMANAAAAAIAAASASVTRGLRPIEPISPLSKADPNISHPARLQDALKGQELRAPHTPSVKPEFNNLRSVKSETLRPAEYDDLKRIRGIGVLIEKRLNSLGIASYDQIADWTSADIDRISQTLDFKGRIEREAWVEQARILGSGGNTEFSRRVDRGDVESSRE